MFYLFGHLDFHILPLQPRILSLARTRGFSAGLCRGLLLLLEVCKGWLTSISQKCFKTKMLGGGGGDVED